jgi:hypothetical protein
MSFYYLNRRWLLSMYNNNEASLNPRVWHPGRRHTQHPQPSVRVENFFALLRRLVDADDSEHDDGGEDGVGVQDGNAGNDEEEAPSS